MKYSEDTKRLLKRLVEKYHALNLEVKRPIDSVLVLSVMVEMEGFPKCLASIAKQISYQTIEKSINKKLEVERKNYLTADTELRSEVIHELLQNKISGFPEGKNFSREIMETINYSALIAIDHFETEVSLNSFTLSFLEHISKEGRDLFKQWQVKTEDLENYYLKFYKEKKFLTIPSDMKGYLENLNQKFQKQEECEILGRGKEITEIWNVLLKKTKRNVVLVGKPGVGKTAIIKKLTWDILHHKCPKQFENFFIVSLNVNALIAGTKYRGEAEERFGKIINFISQNKDVILFVDEIHMIVGAGSTSGDNNDGDFSNALKPILAGDDCRVIGATTAEEYQRTFSKQGALKRRFNVIDIKEPKNKDVYNILRTSIKQLEAFHGVKISKAMVDFIILNASCLNHEVQNPDRTKDLIDLSMATAKRQGKSLVTKSCVMSNFETNLQQFQQMSAEQKKSIAVHEVGHYIVWRKSKLLKNLEAFAVSILPADEYMGITVFDETGVFVENNIEYYTDYIAMVLAGRVCQKKFEIPYSAGASSDLQEATKMAYNIVTRFGMSEISKNRILTDGEDYKLQNEQAIEKINKEIDTIIENATLKAEKLIGINIQTVQTIVYELSKKGIMSATEIETIVQKTNNELVLKEN